MSPLKIEILETEKSITTLLERFTLDQGERYERGISGRLPWIYCRGEEEGGHIEFNLSVENGAIEIQPRDIKTLIFDDRTKLRISVP